MPRLTVGYLENELRKYPKGTEITVGCDCCNHSSSGSSDIINIEDKTNQTYGYIELRFNNKSESDIKLSNDEKEFYERDIEKLKKQIKEKDYKLLMAKDVLLSVQGSVKILTETLDSAN